MTMTAKRKRALFVWLTKWGGALLLAVTLWGALGFPKPAMSGDIARLDRSQADQAIEIFNTKMRSLLAIAPPKETASRRAWEEELATTRQQLNQAQSRKLELSK